MASRIAAGLGGLAVCIGAYSFMGPKAAEAESLTAEQKRTRRIRSHLSGNHPNVSGGDDCLSRKASQLKSHSSGGDAHEGTAENRKANAGTVTHS
mmetsp:Transcript_46467/g.74801  ORF Transcript_46467/g.74801 Transcript_46467/m.74801 type:complete len:95 (+) Transcript_46467:29-313(+)|eukprot:CAMPEP_0179423644 /NCGR_PEP_ID=MMETSP0799-20121207/11131_1 /TAXON_ID=46947 /ORGANISM="Geminigera cryophila, Strain CCMP2564" /LENGTH=94 /DNA_ID=CAMNT_0021197975 /DNA_START=27 /DNA_END=311 /DNA_ORIENTATION=+